MSFSFCPFSPDIIVGGEDIIIINHFNINMKRSFDSKWFILTPLLLIISVTIMIVFFRKVLWSVNNIILILYVITVSTPTPTAAVKLIQTKLMDIFPLNISTQIQSLVLDHIKLAPQCLLLHFMILNQ